MAVDRYLDLGKLEVVVDGELRNLGGRRPSAIVAVLLAELNRQVEFDTLIDVVWSGDSRQNRRSTLNSHVWRVRNVLEPGRQPNQPPSVLLNDADGYRLVAALDTVDSAQFELLTTETEQLLRTDQPDRALQRAQEARSLWRGRPFDGIDSVSWVGPRQARLIEVSRQLGRQHVAALLAVGDPGQALTQLESMQAELPLDEVLWTQRMLAEYRLGRVDAALATFQRARRILDTELGISPGPELQDLQQRILHHDPSLQVRTRANDQHSSEPATEVNLPPQRGRLIGRESDLTTLGELTRTGRLTTVVGPAGCGKTTLAVATAAGAGDRFVDGIWFVDLTDANDQAQVVAALATALKIAIPPTGSEQDAIRAFLARRRMLLVLDNAEHVLEHAADLISELLQDDGELSVLVTSREPLLLPEEQEFQLAPLAVSTGRDEPGAAVELFLERLPALIRDRLGREDLAIIERICSELDGLPLAIELAAARHRSFSLEEIAGQVHSDAGLLQSLGRRGQDHHRTLRSAIDWSYRLLDPSEQALHRRLALVPGAATSAAAAALIDRPETETRSILASLVHRSMLRPRFPDRRSGVTRFAQLATVRAHADATLGDDERASAVARRDEFVAQLLTSRGRRGRPEEAAWMETLDDNLDALRATFQHLLVETPSLHGLDLFSRVGIYWYLRGRMVESRRWHSAVSALIGSAAPMQRALLLVGVGATHCWRSRGDLAREPTRTALELTDDDGADGSVRWGEQIAIVCYSLFAAREAELMTAMAVRLRRVAQATADPDLSALATGAAILDDALVKPPDAVLSRAQAAHDGLVAVDNVLARWFAADGATAAAVAAGDAGAGRLWSDRAVSECLRLRIDEGSVLFEQRGNVFALGQQFGHAAELYSAAQRHQRRNGLTSWNFPHTQQLLDRTRAALGTDRFHQAWQQGELMTLETTSRHGTDAGPS